MNFIFRTHLRRLSCIFVLLLANGCAKPDEMQQLLIGAWLVEDPLLRLCNVYREDGFIESYQLAPADINDLGELESMTTDTALVNSGKRWSLVAHGGRWEAFRGMRFGAVTTQLVNKDGYETEKEARYALKQWFHVKPISDSQLDVWDFRNAPKQDGQPLKTFSFTRVENCEPFEQRLGQSLDSLTNPIW